MTRHWQKKPLVIRQAIAGFEPPLDRLSLLELAAQPEVESRLLIQSQWAGGTKTAPKSNAKAGAKTTAKAASSWQFRHGPFPRRSLPPLKQPGWTLLVQGANLHDERVHALMQQFRFVPEARLDDLMISYATDGGGVGPHFDSYDVFLLQAHGQRRWRIGRQKDFSLVPDMPLKILANFEAEEEFVLNPGDMLYLPPRYAHDGIAMGECMTYSIGFRSPNAPELAQELLQSLAEQAGDSVDAVLYQDPHQPALEHCGEIPPALFEFARKALEQALKDPDALHRALGEYLSEPKANVWFEGGDVDTMAGNVRLDRRTRMLYDTRHVYLNGEGFRAGGRDARLMRRRADERALSAVDFGRLSTAAKDLVLQWCEAGWLYVEHG